MFGVHLNSLILKCEDLNEGLSRLHSSDDLIFVEEIVKVSSDLFKLPFKLSRFKFDNT